jgi:hypothetical protein
VGKLADMKTASLSLIKKTASAYFPLEKRGLGGFFIIFAKSLSISLCRRETE